MDGAQQFGPRRCYLTDPHGHREVVTLLLTSKLTYGEPAEGDAMAFTGELVLTRSSGESRAVIYAADTLLLVGRATFIAGSQLLGECERGGLTLSTDERSDIREPFGLF